MLVGASQTMAIGGAAFNVNFNEGRFEFIASYRSGGRFPAEWHTLGVANGEQPGAAAGRQSATHSPNTVQLGGFPDRRTAHHRELVRCRRAPGSPN